MKKLFNHGEKQNKQLCRACGLYYVEKEKFYCESCEPLMKRTIKEIKEKYGKDN